MNHNEKQTTEGEAGGSDSLLPAVGSRSRMDAITLVQEAAKRDALVEAFRELPRTLYLNDMRAIRIGYARQRDYAARMLQGDELREAIRFFDASDRYAPSPGLQSFSRNLERLRPEGYWTEHRFHIAVAELAGISADEIATMTLPQFAGYLDYAADQKEERAYPGTEAARRRYAIALKRFAHTIRDHAEAYRAAVDQTDRVDDPSTRAIGQALACGKATFRLAVADGSITAWNGLQCLVDAAGPSETGAPFPFDRIAGTGWAYIWDFIVLPRLRIEYPAAFSAVGDSASEWQTDSTGAVVDAKGKRLRWMWRDDGTGILDGDAVQVKEHCSAAGLLRQKLIDAAAFDCIAAVLDGEASAVTNDYIDMDQAAALVGRTKKTLERRLNAKRPKNAMPSPDVEGGGGRPHEWLYSRLKPWLESEFGKVLPDRPPRSLYLLRNRH